MAANNSAFVPTASETAVMLAAIKNAVTEGSFQCNWATVAKELGYKEGSVARDRWGQIRKRIAKCEQATSTGDRVAASVKAIKPASKTTRKRKHDAVDGDVGDNGAKIQPPKVGKKSKKVQPEDGELADAKIEKGDGSAGVV